MKKTSLLAIILVATCTVAMAQPRAIGGRLGLSAGPSYQHQIGKKTMIQADVDMLAYAYGIQGTVTFNWIVPIKSWEKANWNLLAGVGAGGGWEVWNKWKSGYGFVGVAGMVGLEWNFKFPLQLSVEYRPVIGPKFYHGALTTEGKHPDSAFINTEGLFLSAVAAGVRYKFGGK